MARLDEVINSTRAEDHFCESRSRSAAQITARTARSPLSAPLCWLCGGREKSQSPSFHVAVLQRGVHFRHRRNLRPGKGGPAERQTIVCMQAISFAFCILSCETLGTALVSSHVRTSSHAKECRAELNADKHRREALAVSSWRVNTWQRTCRAHLFPAMHQYRSICDRCQCARRNVTGIGQGFR